MLSLVLIGVGNSFAEDVPLSIIDTNALSATLPQGWVISSLAPVPSPSAWRTIAGDRGVQVSFAKTNMTIHHFMGFTYNPSYSFTLMPTNWTGSSQLDQFFEKGILVAPVSYTHLTLPTILRV